jgi:hypothetical protein
MTRVWVPLAAFEGGDHALPFVCARTGSPAEQLVAVRARSPGRWTWLLLLAGVVPYLVVRHFATREVTIELPMTRGSARRRRRARRATAVLAAGCPVAVLLAAADGRRAALLAAAVWLAGALAAAVAAAAVSVGARLDPSAKGVLLTGVNPGFRDAVLAPHPRRSGRRTGAGRG